MSGIMPCRSPWVEPQRLREAHRPSTRAPKGQVAGLLSGQMPAPLEHDQKSRELFARLFRRRLQVVVLFIA
eukprot:13500058-Alexandrium_andersonii.AAC.2